MKEMKECIRKEYAKPTLIELKIDKQFNRLMMSPVPDDPPTNTSPTTGDEF